MVRATMGDRWIFSRRSGAWNGGVSVAIIAACGVLLGSVPARADSANIRPYLVGARAAGMGGAATALADDGAGPYYNPGGIAFALASSLSLSASVYGLVSGTQKDGLSTGHDFTFSDINTFPVSTSAVFKWGPRAEPDGAPVNALAVSVFVPESLVIDDRQTANVELHGVVSQQTEFRTMSEQTIWAGMTYARRFGRLGLGVSGYVLIGTSTASVDYNVMNSAYPSDFGIISQRTDQTVVGLVGAFGARYDVSDHLKLGLSVFTQEAGIYQDRRVFSRVVVAAEDVGAAPDGGVISQGGLHASPTLPWRIQLGAAWVTGPWTFAADAMFLLPLDVHDDVDRASEGLAEHIKRNLVVNGSVGAEYVVRGRFPVRAGFFTDFAASPFPHDDFGNNPNTANYTHVNRYGGSLSIGYRTEHTATDVGTIISYGSGRTTRTDVAETFSVQHATNMTNRFAYIFLASSYIF
jgi:long-chain fatty acid transport protein